MLILVELNEINFDIIKNYIDDGLSLPNFSKIMDGHFITTESEQIYENLEPWIQWPSIHTGLTFGQHKVFRLGDFVNSNDSQIFEKVENAGFKVGAVSPMNSSNKLKTPAYFIPDPWTQTPSDPSFLNRCISSAISQAVNDNSQSKLSFSTISQLMLAFIMLVQPTKWLSMIKSALKSKGKPWQKALFLDNLLHQMHNTLMKRTKPDFSTIFFNAGAHIQHHYFYNSPYAKTSKLKNPSWYIEEHNDPILDMLVNYDKILGDFLQRPNTDLIIATGLSQKPYEELKFYYRMKDHSAFLEMLGIKFQTVTPRMTRDFLVTFESTEDAIHAENIFSKILVNGGLRLFQEIENRGDELFVVLTYPQKVDESSIISVNGKDFSLLEHLVFIAIKNGEHQSKGFAFFSEGSAQFAPKEKSNIIKIHDCILEYFNSRGEHNF